MNVTTQDAQLAVFANAAGHLAPGGCFVVEVIVPQLRRVPPGETARVFTMDPDHVGIETFDDVAAQIAWSHHWIEAGGRLVRHSAPYRYVWPSELDLMARIAGLRLRDRWAGWDRSALHLRQPEPGRGVREERLRPGPLVGSWGLARAEEVRPITAVSGWVLPSAAAVRFS